MPLPQLQKHRDPRLEMAAARFSKCWVNDSLPTSHDSTEGEGLRLWSIM